MIPIVDIFIEKYLNVRSSLISVFIVFTLTYLLFQFTNDNELNELFASEETIEDIQDEENHSNVETKVISNLTSLLNIDLQELKFVVTKLDIMKQVVKV